jgi:hypothetical protein
MFGVAEFYARIFWQRHCALRQHQRLMPVTVHEKCQKIPILYAREAKPDRKIMRHLSLYKNVVLILFYLPDSNLMEFMCECIRIEVHRIGK